MQIEIIWGCFMVYTLLLFGGRPKICHVEDDSIFLAGNTADSSPSNETWQRNVGYTCNHNPSNVKREKWGGGQWSVVGPSTTMGGRVVYENWSIAYTLLRFEYKEDWRLWLCIRWCSHHNLWNRPKFVRVIFTQRIRRFKTSAFDVQLWLEEDYSWRSSRH